MPLTLRIKSTIIITSTTFIVSSETPSLLSVHPPVHSDRDQLYVFSKMQTTQPTPRAAARSNVRLWRMYRLGEGKGWCVRGCHVDNNEENVSPWRSVLKIWKMRQTRQMKNISTKNARGTPYPLKKSQNSKKLKKSCPFRVVAHASKKWPFPLFSLCIWNDSD